MKCDIISGKFPILKVDDFLHKESLFHVKNEIKNIHIHTKRQIDKLRSYRRLYLDEYFKNRYDSYILTTIDQVLFSEEMKNIYNSTYDTAFRLLPKSTYHETQLTIYGNNHDYGWHVDDIDSRLVNWVLFINIDSDFTGGNNEISYNELNDNPTPDIITKPIDNTLIIMPCWVTHRVTPIKCDSSDILKGRITINGHIGFK